MGDSLKSGQGCCTVLYDAGTTDQDQSLKIDTLIDSLNYNNLSLNIYPNSLDSDADARVDPAKQAAYAGVRRGIIDYCGSAVYILAASVSRLTMWRRRNTRKRCFPNHRKYKRSTR
jgi:hypothetical protein